MVDGVHDVRFARFDHGDPACMIVRWDELELQPCDAGDVFEQQRSNAGELARCRIGVGKRGSERVVYDAKGRRAFHVIVFLAREDGVLVRVDAEIRFVEIGEEVGVANGQAVDGVVDVFLELGFVFRDGDVEGLGGELGYGFELRVASQVGYRYGVEGSVSQVVDQVGGFSVWYRFDGETVLFAIRSERFGIEASLDNAGFHPLERIEIVVGEARIVGSGADGCVDAANRCLREQEISLAFFGMVDRRKDVDFA